MKAKPKNYIIVYLLEKLRREECHNVSAIDWADRVEECHNVDEANALTEEDGWFKVSPYGEFPGKIPGRMQKFGKPEAERMVSHFNSLAGRLGRMFRGIPIYIGHPDVDRSLWPDERRLGKVQELQARGDGMWARGEWNALGRENIENGYWIYPSPRWDAPHGSAEFRPDRLLSIGLTNMPRIAESEPVANAYDAADVTSASDGEKAVQNENPDAENPQSESTIMDRKLLIEKLGLAAEATDEEILAKLDAVLKENADMAATEKAKLDAEADKKTAVDEVAAARQETANARVDLAIAEGRIALADRDAWVGRLTGDNRESEANALSAIKPKLNTGAITLEKARSEIGDEAQRRETIANAVAAVQKEGKTYKEAFAAVRADPKFKDIFAAMKEPGREEG